MDHGADTRHYGNRILRAMLLVAMFAVAGGTAHAQEWYLWDFNGKYSTEGTALDTCRLCHPSYPLSFSRNSFGSDFASAAVGNHTFNDILEGTDSDGDGFGNLQEISARTFPGNPASMPPPAATLTGLSITGPASLNEEGTASYAASASWSDGTTTDVQASWSVSPPTVATITAAGALTSLAVASDQVATVSASYTDGGATRSASLAVTILDVPADPPPPDPQVSLMPENGAVDVPVATVVTVTTDGSTEIESVFNQTTFTLTAADPTTAFESFEAATCVAGGVVLGTFGYDDTGTEATFTPLCKLAHATTYTATVTSPSGAPDPAQTLAWTFTTVAQTPDSDDDGVQDGEDDHPHDKGKATPPSPRGTGKFLVDACGNAGIALAQCNALANAEGISDMYPQFNRRGKPFGFHFPDGLVRYTLTGFTPGATVTVTVTFPSGVPRGGRIFKVDSDGFQEALDAVVDGDRVTVTLTDGGSGDADGVVNGVIVDPIGVAVPSGGAASIDLSNSAQGSAGCSMAGPGGGGKETLGSFGLIALACAMVALMRRRTKRGA